jgi:hypothetical protein
MAEGMPGFGPLIERTVNDCSDKPSDSAIDFDTGKLHSIPGELLSRAREIVQPQNDEWDKFLRKASPPGTREVAESKHKVSEPKNDAWESWARANGIDAVGCVVLAPMPVPKPVNAIKIGLLGQGTFATRLDNTFWNQITPPQVESLLARAKLEHHGQPDILTKHVQYGTVAREEFPLTFLFQTREGGKGILQIVGFDEKPKAVKIRYKLVLKPVPNTRAEPAGPTPSAVATVPPATEAEPARSGWAPSAAATGESPPPATEAERAIARLVLVYFEDRLRRAVPAVLVNAGSRTLIVTTGPAVVIPDGVPPAVDRSFLELPGRPAVKAQYTPDGTKELFVYRAEGGLTGYHPDGKVVLEVGDVLSAIITGSSPELSVVSHAARVAALGREATLRLPKPLTPVQRYDRLVEVDRLLPEGTPLFKEGKLAGLVLLGSRFLGETGNISYVVPVDRIATLYSLLEAGYAPAAKSTQAAPELEKLPGTVPKPDVVIDASDGHVRIKSGD